MSPHAAKTGALRTARIHVLERRQRVALGVEEAFEFYGEARNLEAITPPWLRFEVLRSDSPEMCAGALIDYRLRLHGVPVRWRTRIEAWDPPRRFVDVQVSGPYARWEHTHSFERVGRGETVIGDRVRYALPFGPIGRIAHAAFVRRDLERIFDFREQAVAQRLGPA